MLGDLDCPGKLLEHQFGYRVVYCLKASKVAMQGDLP